MTWYSVNTDWVWAIDSHHCTLIKLHCASSMQALYPGISHNVRARNCIVLWQSCINTLQTDLASFIILWHNIVPVHCLLDWTMCSCHNMLYHMMGSFNYPIPWCYVGTPKMQTNTPHLCKLCQSFPAKCCTIVSKQFTRQPPFTKKLLPTVWWCWQSPSAAMASKGQND